MGYCGLGEYVLHLFTVCRAPIQINYGFSTNNAFVLRFAKNNSFLDFIFYTFSSIIIVLNIFSTFDIRLAERVRLNGLGISGIISPSLTRVELYRDVGTTTSCGPHNFGVVGTSICGDVLLIHIISTQQFQFVHLSTPSYLVLCEVEIFAGK